MRKNNDNSLILSHLRYLRCSGQGSHYSHSLLRNHGTPVEQNLEDFPGFLLLDHQPINITIIRYNYHRNML